MFGTLELRDRRLALMAEGERTASRMAGRYARKTGEDLLDLEQEARLGLLEAANRFDATRGVKFTTMARPWIRKAILGYLYKRRALIREPEVVQITRQRLQEERPGEHYSSQGVSPHRLQMARRCMAVVGLEQTSAMLEQPPQQEDASTAVDGRRMSALLCRAMQCLDSPERVVLRARWGLDGEPVSRRELARRLDITQNACQRLEARAMARVRERLLGMLGESEREDLLLVIGMQAGDAVEPPEPRDQEVPVGARAPACARPPARPRVRAQRAS